MRRKRLCLLITGLCAALLPVSAANAQRAVNTQLQAFAHTPFYAGLINRGLAVLPPAVFHKCPTLNANTSQITELSAVIFAQDGYPTSGTWKQRFPVSGCGNNTTLNFYYTANAAEKIDTAIGIPGETMASLTLQGDATTYARIAAKFVIKLCQQFDTTNSTFNGADTPAKTSPAAQRPLPPPWSETWTLQGCGRRVNVNLRFVPNVGGTQIIQDGSTELK